ncbi:(deoxy)nucleoside triphosphate pyrophosphohydrolase [Sulfuriroseicoccus oceanibius]|uniref:8-oxo-dGTP diphosphatase n=1 Tax=Sulfuriroseicoccus oceanibius TaxID=2707525 RepID=A0A6B3L8J6_9BACT|nr:(deoxy)nucleoside triphosphate pyrophosphohydrolase [Sulfuriroseicoccus oceanibius]QQL45202.1 (deoxy)nucleoside triphosphate pyrophosphohydrolase [Sulfuriroseicoccus oceanibius]
MSDSGISVMDVVCAVLVDARQRLLVAQRPLDKSLGGRWEFPGGKVDAGETLAQAMVRELDEELGTDVVVDEAGSAKFLPVDHKSEDGRWLIRLHPMVCELAAGAPEPVALEHLAIDWVALADDAALDAIDWAPGDRRILAQVREWWDR